jgi:transcriptional regulator GlxA family with amidase domain
VTEEMFNVGIFLFDDIELLDFVGPYEVFSVTSELNDDNLFKVFTITQNGREIKSVNGLKVIPDYNFTNHPPIDILVIPGGVGTKTEMPKEGVLNWLRQHYEASQITMSVCSGARLLGKLGLLDNTDATTHHEVIAHIKEIAPLARIKENIRFMDNGKVMTSAGISAGIDLSLHVVEKLCGLETRNKTVVYMEYGNWENLR